GELPGQCPADPILHRPVRRKPGPPVTHHHPQGSAFGRRPPPVTHHHPQGSAFGRRTPPVTHHHRARATYHPRPGRTVGPGRRRGRDDLRHQRRLPVLLHEGRHQPPARSGPFRPAGRRLHRLSPEPRSLHLGLRRTRPRPVALLHQRGHGRVQLSGGRYPHAPGVRG